MELLYSGAIGEVRVVLYPRVTALLIACVAVRVDWWVRPERARPDLDLDEPIMELFTGWYSPLYYEIVLVDDRCVEERRIYEATLVVVDVVLVVRVVRVELEPA